MLKSQIRLMGYDVLENAEGIRFAWNYHNNKHLLESAAFPQHRKGEFDGICGYTTSVSLGCILRAFGCPCKFCRTGTLIPYSDALSAYDIAKQNIFMALADVNCSDRVELHNSPREFAYMGQGEPGYSYPQVREAIKLTNYAMRKLGQKVHRHIISTVGISEMVSSFKDDLRNDFFDERVTLHYSLHAASERHQIMPIEQKYPFKFVLETMGEVAALSGEKPCVGIMLFREYSPPGSNLVYSNELMEVKELLSYLDPQKHRISFCEFNASADVGESSAYTFKAADEILNFAVNLGFEAKLFSSFGKEKATACGMLGGREPERQTGRKWINLEKESEMLINEAYQNIFSASV